MQHAGKHLRTQKKQKKKKVENKNALSHARLVVHRRLVVVVIRRLRHLSSSQVLLLSFARERERTREVNI